MSSAVGKCRNDNVVYNVIVTTTTNVTITTLSPSDRAEMSSRSAWTEVGCARAAILARSGERGRCQTKKSASKKHSVLRSLFDLIAVTPARVVT